MKDSSNSAARKLLTFIQDYYARNKTMPSFAEIAKLVGISVSTVAFHINVLKEYGFLGATDTGRLVPGKSFFMRTLASSVRAGVPAYADDSTPEGVMIDQYLIDTPSRTFLLTIKGESMLDSGLLPGDVVVVKRGVVAVVGDIVVVDANGEGTVKELAQHASGEYFLKARNPEYPDIAPAEGFEIVGVVVGQFRQYARTKPTPSSMPTAKGRTPDVTLNAVPSSGRFDSIRGTSFPDFPPSKVGNGALKRLKVATPSEDPS